MDVETWNSVWPCYDLLTSIWECQVDRQLHEFRVLGDDKGKGITHRRYLMPWDVSYLQRPRRLKNRSLKHSQSRALDIPHI